MGEAFSCTKILFMRIFAFGDRKDLSIMIHLDVTLIEIVLYAFVMLLFIITGLLNAKDMRSLRQEKWTRQDTIALMLRAVFYAFLLNFLIIVGVNVAILFYTTSLGSTVLAQVLRLATTPIQYSLAIFVITGVLYGVAKMKDWYDLIDEED